MLLYIMLQIMLAYLMLLNALFNAFCLYEASFYAIDLCNCFLFSCLVLGYSHIFRLFEVLSYIMHSAFN